MQERIVNIAVYGAIGCFAVYFILTMAPVILAWFKYKPPSTPSARGKAGGGVTINLPDIVKAFATLVDSLVKAGPALTALIGSMVFLVIAGFAAGLFNSG